MKDISVKYNKLNLKAKKEVDDFVDFLLSKQSVAEASYLTNYKQKILGVSTWSEETPKKHIG